MDHLTAIQTLLQGISVAQSKGAFSLRDSCLLYQAVEAIESHLKKEQQPNGTNVQTERDDDVEDKATKQVK